MFILVDRESLVLDVTQWIGDSRYPDICMKSRKFHTILIYAPENITTAQYMRFELDSIDYHHLIILNEASPIDSGGIKGKKTKWGTSLIIHKNSQLMSWRWLRFNKFKHVRIDSCSLIDRGLRIEDLILSRRLLTLTLVNVENLDPWGGIKYYEAPDLRELTINHFNIPFLRKKISKGDLKQLRRLNLANNHIEILEPGFFDSMDRLVLINLEGNQLKTFDHTFDSWPRGVLLDGECIFSDVFYHF